MSESVGNSSFENSVCLLVEDQRPTRDLLKPSIEAAFPGIEVAESASLRQVQDWLSSRGDGRAKKLILAVVDLGLPDGSGIEVVRRLKETEPETRSVVLTIYDSDAHLFDALAAGAFGYILKDDDVGPMIETLKRIRRDEPPLSPSIARRLMDHFRAPGTPPKKGADLTPREEETLTLLSRGLTVPEAAARMGLSPQTVAGYVKVVYQKLQVTSRAEATREAIRRGLA